MTTGGLPGSLDGRLRHVRALRPRHRDHRRERRSAPVGQCLLGVWSPPLYETNTCTQYIQRGQVKQTLRNPVRPKIAAGTPRAVARDLRSPSRTAPNFTLPEEITDMDADEFRQVLRDVIATSSGSPTCRSEVAGKAGNSFLKPGKEGTAEKRIPIESLFHKIVMVRDKLRVLEQKVNAHPRLSVEDKVQMQQYVTQCYGSLTTFNVLFAERGEGFVGQKGDKDD